MGTGLKFVGGVIASAVLVLIIVINFSEARTDLTCDGELKVSGTAAPETAFLDLAVYRWWVHLWGNGSDGNLKVQLDKNALADYVPNIEKIGDGTLVTYMFADPDKKTVGGLRMANGELTLKFGDGMLFTGKCHPR